MPPRRRPRPPIRALLAALAVAAVVTLAVRARAVDAMVPDAPAELVNVPVAAPASEAGAAALDLSGLRGRSGDLRLRTLLVDEVDGDPALWHAAGDRVRTPGVHPVAGGDAPFALATLTPWGRKLGSFVNGYLMGYWPGERGPVGPAQANPDGFIEVGPDDADTPVSTHFTLRDFLTHDQAGTWPKYVVLREALLDKLELVLDVLHDGGVDTRHVRVLSGFRSPQYNAQGAGEGMARGSRHQFGDAADVIIDADRDGRMDDLDGDGRVTFADVQVIDRAVGRVEARWPDLVGGLGLYHAMGPSGPFAHIDVRGTRARWTNLGAPAGTPAGRPARRASDAAAYPARGCRAEGAMAVLCRGG